MLYDISPVLSPELRVWPGDLGLSREIRSDQRRGAVTTGSALHVTVHAGSHVDAPSHYRLDGPSIEACALDAYLGPCEVLRVDVARGGVIRPGDLTDPVLVPRVLFATGTYPDPAQFNEDFAALTPELIDELADAGVKLVGIDTPSVDRFQDGKLPVHQRVGQRDLRILEGLRLTDVPAGIYELIALPLKLAGFDGSPVRAVLRPLP